MIKKYFKLPFQIANIKNDMVQKTIRKKIP